MPEGESRHLRKTLRLKAGDSCLVTDGTQREAEAQIRDFSPTGEAQLKIEKIWDHPKMRESKLTLHAYVAIPQKGKMDWLIEKAQELSLDAIHPLETERTMVKMSREKKASALARWTKIAREAAKQSGSPLLTIALPDTLERILSGVRDNEEIVLFHPRPDALTFRAWIDGLRQKGASLRPFRAVGPEGPLHLFFGPEGGFTNREIQMVLHKAKACLGPTLVSLGPSILKVDTAFLSVTGALKFLFA